ncbi:MAG TPA: ROK family protein [Terriglobia bacterium]|nr:ROK family protein [Terriglobia bacterium]
MGQKPEAIAGIDLGGTSIKALIVDGKYKILAAVKRKTKATAKADPLIDEIASVVEEASKQAGLKVKDLFAVSIGAPGTIDTKRGIVLEAPNLGWKDVKLADELKKLLSVPILVDNDVNVGVVGEHALGAGEKVSELVGIFVGTGIGGGIIIHGELYGGGRGGAGEIGHTVILADGPACSCGHRGCAEALASRTAMERDVLDAIKGGQKSVVPKILKEKEKDRITSSVIQAAIEQKDAVMTEVFKRAQHYLGILVANMVNLLDPERVVIGGGLAERFGEDFVAPIRQTAYEYFLHGRDAKRIKVLPGALGDKSGALGAAVLAHKRLG